MLALNPHSTLPLYAQLAERLLAQIRQGDFVAGDKIPSEHELAREYKLGRPTVRQATDSLLRKGYLERRRGAGTYVRARQADIDLFSLGGTLGSFQQQGIALETELLEAARLVLVEQDARHPLQGRQAFRLRRMGSVQGSGVLLETFWFDAESFPDFDQLDLRGHSLSDVALTRYQMEPTSAEQRFQTEQACPSDAHLLGHPPCGCVLRVERTLNFPASRGAVFAVMQCRTDRFNFSQTIDGPGSF